jgi:hypothetical protein
LCELLYLPAAIEDWSTRFFSALDYVGDFHAGSANILSESLSFVGNYLRQGWAIARLRGDAIQSAAKEPQSLAFGVLFLGLGAVCYAGGIYWMNVYGPGGASAAQMSTANLVRMMLLFLGIWPVLWVGAHAAIRIFCGGSGAFLQVLRPLLLGTVVLWMTIIPFAGFLAGAIWWHFVVVPGVFREVHKVSFGKAIGVYLAVHMVVSVIVVVLFPPPK